MGYLDPQTQAVAQLDSNTCINNSSFFFAVDVLMDDPCCSSSAADQKQSLRKMYFPMIISPKSVLLLLEFNSCGF